MTDTKPYFISRATETMSALGAPDADVADMAAWAQAERGRYADSRRSLIVDASGHIHAVARTHSDRGGRAGGRIESVTDPAHAEAVGAILDFGLAVLSRLTGQRVIQVQGWRLMRGAGLSGVGRQDAPEQDEGPRMDPGELRAVREYLGLTYARCAGRLGVREDTLRRWESGRDPIPYRIPEQIGSIEDITSDAVDALAAVLRDDATAVAYTYRDDAAFAAAHPEHAALGARWWRHVIMRAAEQVDRAVEVTSDHGATSSVEAVS